MKIHLENVDLSARSGPNSFAKRLAVELTSRGHSIVDLYNQSDVSCVFIQSNSSIPNDHPKVHRLDGIWFKPEQFVSHNVQIKKDYLQSSRVIWQSNFDKNMTNFHWGPRPGSVINNGISMETVEITNKDILNIRKSFDNVFVCSANWHPQKRLEKNIEAYNIIKQKIDGSSVLLVLGSLPYVQANQKDVLYTGSITHEMCLQTFKVSDWMIHMAWLDHCPNTVVEALSQGCPVICTDSGGTHEIVRKNGIVIPENIRYNFELTDYDKPYDLNLEGLEEIDWSKNIKVESNYLDIKNVADLYLKEFRLALGD